LAFANKPTSGSRVSVEISPIRSAKREAAPISVRTRRLTSDFNVAMASWRRLPPCLCRKTSAFRALSRRVPSLLTAFIVHQIDSKCAPNLAGRTSGYDLKSDNVQRHVSRVDHQVVFALFQSADGEFTDIVGDRGMHLLTGMRQVDRDPRDGIKTGVSGVKDLSLQDRPGGSHAGNLQINAEILNPIDELSFSRRRRSCPDGRGVFETIENEPGNRACRPIAGDAPGGRGFKQPDRSLKHPRRRINSSRFRPDLLEGFVPTYIGRAP